jgi:hypothetical protein
MARRMSLLRAVWSYQTACKMTPIAFDELRRQVGLAPIASGRPEGLLVQVAPANASSVNSGAVTALESLSALPAGVPRGSSAGDLLLTFSWRSSVPTGSLLTPVVDQGLCGCCWAVAVAGSLNDRFAVRDAANPLFLFQELMACGNGCLPCARCSPDDAFVYAREVGLTPSWELHQKPPSFAELGSNLEGIQKLGFPSGLPSSQTSGYEAARRNGVSARAPTAAPCSQVKQLLFPAAAAPLKCGGPPYRGSSILAVQRSIMYSGPVVTIMRVYVDFIIGSDPRNGPAFASTEGVYIHRHGQVNYGVPSARNKDLGAHCMVIVGWGQTASGVKYWEVRNSWGTAWGEKGYCKIAMTSAALQNSSVGIDVAITSVQNNISKHEYGCIWVSVRECSRAPRFYSLSAPVRAPAREAAAQWRTVAAPLSLAAALLLLFLCYKRRRTLASSRTSLCDLQDSSLRTS